MVWDYKLRDLSHIVWAYNLSINAILALKRVQHLRLEAIRQFYNFILVSVTDSISVILTFNATINALFKLDAIQKITASSIIKGFKTVFFHITESQANIGSMKERFHSHELRLCMKLCCKSPSYKF